MEKKENNLKNKINELKKTTKGKAYLKLIRWAIFFFALLIFCLIASFITGNNTRDNKNTPANNNNNEPTINEPVNPTPENPEDNLVSILSLKEFENSLLTSTYDYNYEITIANNITKYEGHKNLTSEYGYKETSASLIKYYIDETGTYEEKMPNKVPITNLYEGLNSEYFNLTNLINTINNLDIIQDPTNPNIFNTADELNKYKMELATNYDNEENYLKTIEITGNNYVYKFNFKNVGAV